MAYSKTAWSYRKLRLCRVLSIASYNVSLEQAHSLAVARKYQAVQRQPAARGDPMDAGSCRSRHSHTRRRCGYAPPGSQRTLCRYPAPDTAATAPTQPSRKIDLQAIRGPETVRESLSLPRQAADTSRHRLALRRRRQQLWPIANLRRAPPGDQRRSTHPRRRDVAIRETQSCIAALDRQHRPYVPSNKSGKPQRHDLILRRHLRIDQRPDAPCPTRSGGKGRRHQPMSKPSKLRVTPAQAAALLV